ncbi:Gfo/Idh/MocA family oxidoreductase [Cohnella cellulosilytica]|uniref:Gfo/Idh/MocA family oxidoreductase n=1 Tax=Cohnella cellulosilytica TaxID=986710 RepID=A0ABW2FP61_9BACL
MTHKKWRVIVCGSTFGQFYLEALALLPDRYELAGLLARGSDRSRRCAAYYGVPLYTGIEQLPDDIDAACVVLRSGVMGGQGTELSLALLERGIHVMQEQPIHHKDLALCLRAARRRGAVFRTGDLYVHLPAVRRFIAAARTALQRQEPLYIDAAFASQVSYPMVHILAQALPSIRPWSTAAAGPQEGPFRVLTGKIGQVPAVLRVHNEVDPEDPDNYLHLLHQAAIGFAGGSLSLTDTHGPVVWRPRLHVPDASYTLGELSGAAPDYMREHSTETLGSGNTFSYGDLLAKLWPQAIARDLTELGDAITDRSEAERRAAQELLCASQWHELTAAIGYPTLRPGLGHQPLPIHLLRASASAVPDEIGPGQAGEEQELASCTAPADIELRGIGSEQVGDFIEKLHTAVFGSMLNAMQAQGTLTDSQRTYGIAEILSAANVSPRHHSVIMRWLGLLAERGYIKRREGGFSGTEIVLEGELDERWQAVRAAWDGKLGSPLTMDYLIENARRLPQLMSGEQQAALLLFPEGKMDYADALYRETVTARYLNQSVAEAVARIAALRKRSALRLVEIGAGTGATTDAIVARWQAAPEPFPLNYLFTDVSSYFLTAAQSRYSRYPWMRYELADIDIRLEDQGIEASGADVVVAAGVLNNAQDTDRTVRGILELLVPDGWLLLTEPVGEFPEILISQAFMMTPPQDDRARSQTTFMSASQWQDVFRRAGAAEVLTFPADDHPLAPLGQKLFAVRKGTYA